MERAATGLDGPRAAGFQGRGGDGEGMAMRTRWRKSAAARGVGHFAKLLWRQFGEMRYGCGPQFGEMRYGWGRGEGGRFALVAAVVVCAMPAWAASSVPVEDIAVTSGPVTV